MIRAMIPPAVGSAVATGVFGYMNTRMQIAADTQARREQREADADARREQLASSALQEQLRRENERWLREYDAGQAQLREQRAADAALAAQLQTQALEHYPIPQGPRFLRDSLQLDHEEAGERRLLILIAPKIGEEASDEVGRGLRLQAVDDIQTFTRGKLRPWLIDRPLQWPNRDLYVCDLYDVPTVILQISVANGRLSVRLGGCNIGLQRAEDLQPVYRLSWPSPDDWSEETIVRLNESGFTDTHLPVRRPATEEELRRLNHELASRIVALSVVAATDAYYLAHETAYDELIDDAVVAAGPAADGWPADAGFAENLLADPAYHYLHRARRRLLRREDALAESDFRAALAMLAGDDNPRRRLSQLAATAAHLGTLRPHHRDLALALTAQAPRRVWPASLAVALRSPAADLAPAESVLHRAEHEGEPTLVPAGNGEANMKGWRERKEKLDRDPLLPKKKGATR